MSHEDLTNMPDSFTAGNTLTYLRPATVDFDTTWTMTAIIAGEKKVQKKAVDEGGSFRVTFKAGATSLLTAGAYQWVHRMKKAGDVHDMEGGKLIVLPDLLVAAAGDLQSWASKTLPLVEAAIAGRIPSGNESYQIAGRAISKIPIAELIALRSKIQSEVFREENPGRATRRHRITFPSTT